MLTDIDSRLRADGDRWRASLTEGPDLERLLPARPAPLADRAARGSRRWLAVAAAAAVVGGTAVGVASWSGPSATHVPAGRPGTSGVVASRLPVTSPDATASLSGRAAPSPLVVQPVRSGGVPVTLTVTAPRLVGLTLGPRITIGFAPDDPGALPPLDHVRVTFTLPPGRYHPRYAVVPALASNAILGPILPDHGYRPCTPATIEVTASGPNDFRLDCGSRSR